MSRPAAQGHPFMKASETLRAPAKLNLTLEVLAKRADGLHGVRSVMVPVDLCDEVRIERSSSFRFTCDVSELAEANLVERTVRALHATEPHVHISLHKRIPTGAGMGGGSSDAAAILLAAQRGSLGDRYDRNYLAIARSLGSDVPFFLVQTAALVEGAGERVTALGAVPPWHAVIVKPPVAVSTAWAYERIDAAPRASRPRNASLSLAMAEALQRREFERAVSLLHNDFHDVIASQTPQIARALDLLRAAGASHALMTGSGSCVFALAETVQERDELASRIELPGDFKLYACAFWNGEAWRSAA
jgi:4-diphosphocytidyl-2-C-methyl-D-erythritol kinase